ncbi:hypothetical protein AMTRI_Chr03g142120 [Amborella trichopoda]
MGFVRVRQLVETQKWFDEMPQRNVTTWNSIISAYALNGQPSSALQLFLKILNMGFRPTGFTFLTILVSYVSLCHGKEAHARLIRQDLGSNLITSNALMDMYGKFGSVGYLFNMLCSMEERDRISWNTSMAGCKGEIALRLFQAMIMAGVSPDQFTLSTMITACVGLRDLRSGEQIFSKTIESGFYANDLVLASLIDLFAKCDRLCDSSSIRRSRRAKRAYL